MGLFVDKLTALTATKIVAVSKVVLDIVKSELNSNTQKVIQISNGIDIEKFESKELVRTVLANKNEIIIGTIARQTDWKGLQYTAESFVNLHLINSNTKFHLVGAPADATGKIMQILSNLDSNCYQVDESIQDVSDFFNSIDIFVHVPVGKLEEAFGLVYIEALASGVQCVFTKSGVLNEIPEIETYASIVDYENSEEILEAMLTISSTNSIAYPPVPQKILQDYSLDSMSKKYVQLLRNGRN
jgi:glycosyltransferase involved in cell wall biosynthesis